MQYCFFCVSICAMMCTFHSYKAFALQVFVLILNFSFIVFSSSMNLHEARLQRFSFNWKLLYNSYFHHFLFPFLCLEAHNIFVKLTVSKKVTVSFSTSHLRCYVGTNCKQSYVGFFFKSIVGNLIPLLNRHSFLFIPIEARCSSKEKHAQIHNDTK